MTPYKVFIVGHEGTTGLRIHERLTDRKDIELLATADEDRKNVEAIKEVAKEADIVFLCLPDAASKEIMTAIGELPCKVIDTSTAFRTADDWAYGFPELGADYKTAISTEKHIANPGCHASGMIACIAPLVKAAGLVPTDYPFTITSLTGYSGGGKKMIGQYESEPKDYFLYAPRQYGLSQQHKHLPEVQHVCGLSEAPIFIPIVDDYYSGMEVTVGIHSRLCNKPVSINKVQQALEDFYKDSTIITVVPFTENSNTGMLNANQLSNTDSMKIYVTGNDERIMVHAIFDNLGKGASGAAVQCMNIALGLPEDTGLALG